MSRKNICVDKDGYKYIQTAWGKAYNIKDYFVRFFRIVPLRIGEVLELSPGTDVWVLWEGGAGPYRYTISPRKCEKWLGVYIISNGVTLYCDNIGRSKNQNKIWKVDRRVR